MARDLGEEFYTLIELHDRFASPLFGKEKNTIVVWRYLQSVVKPATHV